MQDLFFYFFIFAFILCFLWLGKYRSFFEKIGLITIIGLSVFRFDIGNDYDNYYYLVDYSIEMLNTNDLSNIIIVSTLLGIEPFFELLCFLFRNVNYPFVYVLGVYGALTIMLWYKLLHRIDGVFGGFFFIITFTILFVSFDQVRQILAVTIFLYSLYYIEQRNWKKYWIIIFLATCVHYSAILVSFAYYILHRKPYIKVYLIIILIFYIGTKLNIWEQFRGILFSLIGLYSEYSESDKQLGSASFNSGLGLLFQVIFYSFLMIMSEKKYPVLTNSLFIGIVLILFSSGNLNINRIAYYFTYSAILAFPLYLKNENNKLKIFVLSIFMLVYCVRNIYGGASGCFPYDSVWSDNFKSLYFRTREYRLQ